MSLRPVLLVVATLVAASAAAQSPRERVRDRNSPREHTRPAPGTVVSQAQAEALTLTVGAVTERLVQTWVRAAGVIDKANKTLSADITGPDAALIKPGQRVRAFPPNAKSSMYQAFVTRVAPRANGVAVEATLAAQGRQNASVYVIEIVVEQGPYLSVPNEAIIEEGDRHVVYVERQTGQYEPQDVQIGLQGELYTQVTNGVKDGDRVVTFGSFFIDAEHKLKGVDQSSPHGAQ
jgi:Cu(I)/Ag(I) efflux system membrane fusion protein